MARLGKINDFKATAPAPPLATKEKAVRGSGLSTEPHKGPDKITYANSGIVPTATSSKDYVDGALREMTEQQFLDNQKQMNVSEKDYWQKQLEQHPESSYATMKAMIASAETPLDKQKRERREQLGQVFANLGNVIGNAANLYHTSKGAPNIDLNTSMKAQNERIQKIKDKRQALKDKTDLLLLAAKKDDVAAARAEALAREKMAADKAYDLYKFNINIGLAKERNDAIAKGNADKLAETKRHNAAMESRWRSQDDNKDKIVDSAMGSDGSIYTRNSPLTENEAKQFIEMSDISDDELEQFIVEDKDVFGNVTNRRVDWRGAAAHVLGRGDVPSEELRARGFKKSGDFNYNNHKADESSVSPGQRKRKGIEKEGNKTAKKKAIYR